MSVGTWFRGLFEQRTHPSSINEVYLQMLGLPGRETASGVEINENTALYNTSVWACVRVLAESVASLPLILYRRRDDRGKERATDHPLYSLLHDLPNPEMTALEWRELMMGHLLTWGNAYSEIDYNGAGRITGLWPLRPDRVSVKRLSDFLGVEAQSGQDNPLVYLITLRNGGSAVLPAERVMHLRGLSSNGIIGYSPIALARQAIGLGLATEEYGAAFFGNGATAGTILQHPGRLSKEAHQNLRETWNQRHQGLSNAHRTEILEEGMTIAQIGIPPEESQFLETRKFQVNEIARLYRIPPHMIGDLERSTNNNIEHQGLEFVTNTLRPWLVRWEQAISRDLLLLAERKTYFAEHLVDGLLRGDMKSRYDAYALGRQNGWFSANDILELENRNPIPNGDIYLVPLNMVPVEQVLTPPATTPGGGPPEAKPAPAAPPEPNQARAHVHAETADRTAGEERAANIGKMRVRLAASYERVFRDTMGRIIRRETADVRRACKKWLTKRSEAEFLQWLLDFYTEHRAFWQRQILPLLLTYADSIGVSVGEEIGAEAMSSDDIRQFITDYVTATSYRETDSSYNQLKAILRDALDAGEDPEPLIEERLGGWDDRRADELAQDEAHNSLNAFGLAFYTASRRVTRIRWESFGGCCDFCKGLDGKVVGLEETFLAKGEELTGEGSETLTRRTNITHPPIHRACKCAIVADL